MIILYTTLGMASRKMSQIKEGMVLEHTVCNADGQVLLPEGATISSKHLNIFTMWGVTHVDIIIDENNPDEEEKAFLEEYQRCRLQVIPRFKRCDLSHRAVESTIRFCAERLAEINLNAA